MPLDKIVKLNACACSRHHRNALDARIGTDAEHRNFAVGRAPEQPLPPQKRWVVCRQEDSVTLHMRYAHGMTSKGFCLTAKT
jgi:hypothetical protein